MSELAFRGRDQRPLAMVPRAAWGLLTCALALQVALAMLTPRPPPEATDLAAPPSLRAVAAASLGDPLASAKVMNLLLQTHDNQPGLSIPFARLDYPMVILWLTRILEIDPAGPYPLLAASRLYGEVPDPQRARLMLEFVHRQFHANPERRWPALVHAAHVARHRLGDIALARRYAASLRMEATAPSVPAWVRQIEILLLADINDIESARVLLGGLVDSGQLSDPAEYRFLMSRLNAAAAGHGSAPVGAK